MIDYQPVMETRDLGPGQRAGARAHDTDLALVNVGQTYYALDARCPRDGTHLGEEGRLRGHEIVCPHDGSAFDVRSGRPTGAEAGGEGLRRFDLRVEENRICIGPPLQPSGAAGGD